MNSESIKILLVDDDEEDYIITCNLLEKIEGGNFQVEWESSYLAAVEIIKERRHDIYLVDYSLGEYNGVDLVRLVVESDCNALVTMLTGQGEIRVDMEAITAGAADYLVKGSVTPAGLERSFRHGLERKRAAEALRQSEERYRTLNETLEQQITERTSELQTANSELQIANKELEAFTYSVSHDLRAPLRAIDGFSQVILEDYADKLDEEARSYLSRMCGASREMSQIIDGMLQLSHLPRCEMRREMVSLTALAAAVVAELQQQEPDRIVRLNIEGGLWAYGDKSLLKIMLTNLLGNAWKFTSKREIAEIALGKEGQDSQPVYFIRDNGAGFNMAKVAKLFGPFQRFHNAEEFRGTGIGLATVQRVVHRHGGRIWAEGVVNYGASFYFTLGATASQKNHGN